MFRRLLSVTSQQLASESGDKSLAAKDRVPIDSNKALKTKEELEHENKLQGYITVDAPVSIKN